MAHKPVNLDVLLEGIELNERERRQVQGVLGVYRALNTGEYQLFQDAKWHVAAQPKRNLTVPELYDSGYKFKFWGKEVSIKPNLPFVNKEVQRRVRAILIGEYLLSERDEVLDVKESSDIRVSRLEGELRRYGAHQAGRPVKYIRVSPELVNLYCKRHQLQELKPFILKKLNLS